jgi:uracil-DNA glycosylase
MTREEQIKSFVVAISEPSFHRIHNPWRDLCTTELRPDGCMLRQERLRRHLNAPNPRLLIIGEAPGYQGCRYSGLAFSSERLLVEKAIPRMNGLDGERITNRGKPWSEPSATIVWGALYEHGLAMDTVMFNAVPWHPEGARGIHSNRTPSTDEKTEGLKYVPMLLKIFPGIKVAALGNTSSDMLTELCVEHVKLRHPANGGAGKFRAGLADLVRSGI